MPKGISFILLQTPIEGHPKGGLVLLRVLAIVTARKRGEIPGVEIFASGAYADPMPDSKPLAHVATLYDQ